MPCYTSAMSTGNPDTYHFIAECPFCKEKRGVACSLSQAKTGAPIEIITGSFPPKPAINFGTIQTYRKIDSYAGGIPNVCHRSRGLPGCRTTRADYRLVSR